MLSSEQAEPKVENDLLLETFWTESLEEILQCAQQGRSLEEIARAIFFTALGAALAWEGTMCRIESGTGRLVPIPMSIVSDTFSNRDEFDAANLLELEAPSVCPIDDKLNRCFQEKLELNASLGGYLVIFGSSGRPQWILLLGPSCVESDRSRIQGWLKRLSLTGSVALGMAEMNQQVEESRRQMDRKTLQMQTLLESDRELHRYTHWDLLTKNVLYSAMGHLGIPRGVLLASQQAGGDLRVIHERPVLREFSDSRFALSPEDPLVGQLEKNRLTLSRDTIEKAYPGHPLLKFDFEVAVPGVSGRGIEFVILLGGKLDGQPLADDEIEYLTVLGAQAAVVFENRDLIRQSIQSEKLAAIGQALAALSHDFRGILNGLVGANRHLSKVVEGLEKNRFREASQLRRWVDVIDANEKRLSNLVEEIVEYAKPREPRREVCSLNDLVSEALEQYSEGARKNNIDIQRHTALDLPVLQADTTRIYRALCNLIHNALDAVEPGKGKIHVRTENTQQGILLEVKDNGPGIAPEHLDSVFDPLFTTKKGSGGTGFGLANVRKIVEEHGGTVSVASTPGQGSILRIVLPASADSTENIDTAGRL